MRSAANQPMTVVDCDSVTGFKPLTESGEARIVWFLSAAIGVQRNLALCSRHDPFHVEAEFLQQLLERRRSSKGFDTDVGPFRSGIFAPAKVRRHFN